MNRLAVAAAALAGLVLGLAASLAVVALDDDDEPWSMPMQRSQVDDDAPYAFGGPGMGPGMMGGAFVGSEEDFLLAMIPHHEEAVSAARELARSSRPEMRELGAAVVASQTAQIEQMEGWLDEWYDDPPAADYEPMMRDLSDLSGDELDRAFLEDMIPHHMAAVMMSQQLLMHRVVDHPEVARLADDIRDEQRREIFLMQGWWNDWFA